MFDFSSQPAASAAWSRSKTFCSGTEPPSGKLLPADLAVVVADAAAGQRPRRSRSPRWRSPPRPPTPTSRLRCCGGLRLGLAPLALAAQRLLLLSAMGHRGGRLAGAVATRAGPDRAPAAGARRRARDFGLEAALRRTATISPVSRSGVSRSSSTDDAWTSRAFGQLAHEHVGVREGVDRVAVVADHERRLLDLAALLRRRRHAARRTAPAAPTRTASGPGSPSRASCPAAASPCAARAAPAGPARARPAPRT